MFEAEIAQSSLDTESENLVRHYADRRYVILDSVMDNFEAAATDIIDGLEVAKRKQNNPQVATWYQDRIQDAWVFQETVKKLALAPKVLSLLRLLYRREPIPFQTLNFWRGTEQTTHSDTIHFNSFPSDLCAGSG
ncbi:MAG: hypothetical protein F6J93_37405 [Oscillatoria sp. SIO1A7]|nr:hypothetical protein [Oscillatoria sp. SIO1A7]